MIIHAILEPGKICIIAASMLLKYFIAYFLHFANHFNDTQNSPFSHSFGESSMMSTLFLDLWPVGEKRYEIKQ